MTPEQQAAYSEGLLDAIDVLHSAAMQCEQHQFEFSVGITRANIAAIKTFRDQQINSVPQ